jgi:RNA polymerase sigma factor (sigma-70 family)
VRRFLPLVHARARMLGLEPAMADWDDAVSDGMEALWLAARDHDPARGPFAGYAGRRVYWAMVDGRRRRGGRGRRRHSDDLLVGDFAALEEPGDGAGASRRHAESVFAAGCDPAADGRAAMARVLACARQVDPRLPEIVVLCYFGYSYTEAGRAVGISRQWASQLMGRLRARLTRDQVVA